MNDSIIFLNKSWLIPVILGWLLLLIIFIWKEWSVDQSKRIWLRVLLVLFALSSLAIIALEPAFPEIKKEESLVIITKNFKKDHLDSLQQVYKKTERLDYTKGEKIENVDKAKEVFVLGEGIKPYDFWAFKKNNVKYLPGDSLSGIVQLKAPSQLQVGKNLELLVNYHQPIGGNRIVLESPSGQTLDSIVFQSNGDTIFKLSTAIKVTGDFVFSVSEKDSLGKLLMTNPLPLRAIEQKPLRLLMLNGFPTFQMKYLKNFLATQGHKVVVKNRVTRGKFKLEFLNTNRINLNRLSLENLSNFDMIIADAISIRNLTVLEGKALKESIEKEGLGLLLLDDINQLNSLRKVLDIGFQNAALTKIRLNGSSDVEVNTQAFRLKPDVGLETIHEHDTGILSGYKRQGLGRIGASVLRDTWQLKLEGQSEPYQLLWSKLIAAVSKPDYQDVKWDFMEQLPIVHEPLPVKMRTAITTPVVVEAENQIPLQQDLYNANIWSGIIYPRKTGWQDMRLSQDSTLRINYYVHSEKDWEVLKAYQTREANCLYFNNVSDEVQDKQVFFNAVNPLWFFGLFLLSIGGLWLEPKI